MGAASIPVDLLNPGQVFACLGFLEAADALQGDAEGGFAWGDESTPRFSLRASGGPNPVEAVLEFLADVEPEPWAPVGYDDSPSMSRKASGEEEDDEDGSDGELAADEPALEMVHVFPAGEGDRMALPIRIGGGNRPTVELGHWADGSSRANFKLYSGNRSADRIARAMLGGTRKKPTKRQRASGLPGDLKTKGLRQLWEEDQAALIAAPFHVLTPMGGSFNFDPRGAWTAIDAGYSPNVHKHAVQASPIVEFLAAWGLEHARPVECEGRTIRYAAWGAPLPPILARPALAGTLTAMSLRYFRFHLDSSGKNKVVTFAQEEPHA